MSRSECDDILTFCVLGSGGIMTFYILGMYLCE